MKQFDEQPCLDRLIEVLSEASLRYERRTRRLTLCYRTFKLIWLSMTYFVRARKFQFTLVAELLWYWADTRLRKARSSFPKIRLARIYLSNSNSETDCLLLLPQEILFLIVEILSITDFLAPTLVSKAIAVIFGCQAFWKTRSLPQAKRSYFDSSTDDDCGGDRRVFCRCTGRENHRFPEIDLQRRLWLRNRWIKSQHDMVGVPDCSPEDHETYQGRLHWDNVSGPIQCDRDYRLLWSRGPNLDPNCFTGSDECFHCQYPHPLKPQRKFLLTPIVRIDKSILAEEEHTFIKGFDLVFFDRRTRFGYRVPRQRVMLDLQGQVLREFELMIGWGGVHAIRLITDQTSNDKRGVSS